MIDTIFLSYVFHPLKNLLLCLCFLIGFHSVKGDCLACWELRKVEITCTNGKTLTGYVQWNESWLVLMPDYKVWQNRFPESYVPYYSQFKHQCDIFLYKQVFPVKNDSIREFIATKKECMVKFDIKQIKSIREIDKDKKKYTGADELPVFTQAEINRLRTNPIAMKVVDQGVADIIFLSYNPSITGKQLSTIDEQNYEQKKVLLKGKGVICYSLGYD
jgi:hypothetical protein